ncbi:MAG: NAD(P)(+) transhydrogenase (Re/Si-specific) subunit beta [Nitrospiria bacterium]
MDQVIQTAYLLAAIFFICGLKSLSTPETASRGLRLSQAGMLIAIVATLLHYGVVDYDLIAFGVAIGAVLGIVMAIKTRMPDSLHGVALLNGFGGLASVLVGAAEFFRSQANLSPYPMAFIAGTLFIGVMTASGSAGVFFKRGGPRRFPFQHGLSLFFFVAAAVLMGYLAFAPSATSAFFALCVVSFMLGVLIVMPVSVEDRPVVISLLNAFSGVAAAASGFVLNNNILIMTGALAGSAGMMLCQSMCGAEGRSLANVLFGGFRKI